MDEIDAANEREEYMTMAAIRTALNGRPRVLSSGVCQSCDLPIEAERLHANPYAVTCRDCAAEQEGPPPAHPPYRWEALTEAVRRDPPWLGSNSIFSRLVPQPNTLGIRSQIGRR